MRQRLGVDENSDEFDYMASIDHIVGLGDGYKVLQYRVVEDQDALDASDHSPVFADIEFI
jgi:endonuclease/exonuclease/phosphatase family metal-dependent hydrolase